MTSELACVACVADPQVTSMVVPMAQATLIAIPFFFRARIASAIRRVAGRAGPEASADEEGCDTPADDGRDGPEPPGTIRP